MANIMDAHKRFVAAAFRASFFALFAHAYRSLWSKAFNAKVAKELPPRTQRDATLVNTKLHHCPRPQLNSRSGFADIPSQGEHRWEI
jgi:hypothetical protein